MTPCDACGMTYRRIMNQQARQICQDCTETDGYPAFDCSVDPEWCPFQNGTYLKTDRDQWKARAEAAEKDRIEFGALAVARGIELDALRETLRQLRELARQSSVALRDGQRSDYEHAVTTLRIAVITAAEGEKNSGL